MCDGPVSCSALSGSGPQRIGETAGALLRISRHREHPFRFKLISRFGRS
jgi:hypothetical protein